MTKRTYRGTAQAEVAALTRQRILDAVISLSMDHWVDEITLDQIATRSGVTVQTILRHFGSKDGLAVAAAREGRHTVNQQRSAAIPGDIDDIVSNLADHYEEYGDRVFRTLAQEEIVPQFKGFLQEGRSFHRQWVEHVFAPWLETQDEPARQSTIIQLITACDVYTWKLIRRDHTHTSEQYRAVLKDMLNALLSHTSGA